MQINRTEFLDALSSIKAGISTKDRVEQSACVVFSGGKMATYNEQILAMTPFDLGFEGAVRAEELLGILSKLAVEKIDLSLQDGQVILKAGRSKSGIRFEEAIKLPVSEILGEYETIDMIPMGDSLLPAFQKAKFCASQSMNNLRLTGLHVKEGKVTATDNYRIIQVEVQDKSLKKLPEFLLPASAVDFLSSYSPEKIGVSNSWAFFASKNGLLFCVRLINSDEPYPDVSPFSVLEGPELILPIGLVEAIDKTSVFTKSLPHESDKTVSVTMKPGRVLIRGEGSFGWYEENVLAKEYQGEEIKFFAHPEFLRAIIPQVQRAILGDRAILFQGEDFFHVFALCTPSGGD